ncbi:MAG: TonB-dependent receptor [Bryobacterales bacterium]|nr:TonB-dependent receptor [Bryobacterales bacterium]
MLLRSFSVRAAAALLLIAGYTRPALFAQTTATEILGIVKDSSGAVVAGAQVTITRVATGIRLSKQTDQNGEYAFPLLEIGQYTVHAEKTGFRAQTVTELRLETQQKARVDFTLTVGNVTESVEVVASGAVLETENSTVGQVIENKRIADLPLNGRNLIHLAAMVPGVQYGSRSGRADGQGGFPIPGGGMSVIANGQREVHQSITLDGVESIAPLYNISSFTPSIDAVEEFKVQTGSYSAEFGQSSGGRVEISLKSGTNSLHATVWEFLRNDAFDAETYFLNFQRPASAGRLKKDRLRRNQFGGFFSGPVIKNKAFWSFNYEERRQTQESVATAWWPNQNFRKGDFSLLLNPPTNPATSRPVRNPIAIYDPLTGIPFSGNILPASRQHPGALNVIDKFLPLPDFQQLDPLDFTVSRAVPSIIGARQYFGRLDHNFSSKDKVFGRFALDKSEWEANQINPNFPEDRFSDAYNVATQWIHTFSANILHELRFGINNWGDNYVNPRSNSTFDPDSLGIGRFRVAGDGNRKFTAAETGIPGIGFTIGDPQGRTDDTYSYQIADNLSVVRGKHSLKFGTLIVHAAMDRRAANLTRGSLSFSPNESGLDFASLLLGYPNRSLTAEGYPSVNMRSRRVGAYVTDEWRVRSNLTITAGLRFDYMGNPYDKLGHVRTVSLERPYTTPSGAQIPTLFPKVESEEGKQKLWKQVDPFWQPRLGIAYRPTNKWVIRTGAGQYTSPQHFVQISTANLMPPLSGFQQYDSITDAVPGSSTRMFRPGLPILTLNDPFIGAQARPPVSVWRLEPDRRERDVWQWSFDIQRELPGSMAMTIGYVGSKTSHSANSYENFNGALPSRDTNFQARRPIQQFFDPSEPEKGIQTLGRIFAFDSYSNQHYHGLQTKLERRYSQGLSFGISYTYGKANGDGEDGGNEGAGRQVYNDRAGSRARTSFDLTHNAVIHFVYEIPFGKNLKGVAGAVLKGWQTNGILSLRSGFPWTPTVGANDLNTGGDGTPIRPDRLRDGRLSDATRALWYDPSAFQRVNCNIASRPDLCHYGNSGRNIMTTPGQRNIDFSLFKNFAVTERIKVQFRGEAFNTFNTPYFGQPNNLGFVSLNSITPDAPRVGEIRSLSAAMRVMQFGIKLSF